MNMRFAAAFAVVAVTGCSAVEDGVNSVASAAGLADVVDGECKVLKPVDELTYEEASAVYACIQSDLLAGYQTGDKRWIPADFVNDYRNWTPVSTLPANPGFHGDRYLLTFVNEAGAAEYLKYEAERGPMPVGTVIAKESFGIGEDGAVNPGPLFFMQKAEAACAAKQGGDFELCVNDVVLTGDIEMAYAW